VGIPERKKAFRRPGRIWDDNIKIDFQENGTG
jgi:hypothetical protein